MNKTPLVTAQWLKDNLHHTGLRVVDIRGRVLPAGAPPPHYFSHRAEYEEAHIPGAVFVDWTRDIVDPESPSGDVAPPEQFVALMSALGISDDTPVVVYDDAESMLAARFWWAMKYYGHDACYILDGGWNQWVTEGFPITSEIPAFDPGNFTPSPNPSLRRNAHDVAGAIGNNTVLVDVRSSGEFAGETSRARRYGHIPGAVNLPRSRIVADGGRMPSVEALREKFAEIGIKEDDEVIVYCNSGVSASYGILAMLAAGLNNVAVYDGSWKEWANDETNPIEA